MAKVTVIKFGGSISKDENIQKAFLKNLAKLFKKQPVVLVHGGGPEINKWLEKAGIKSKFINGLRFTDEPTLEIVEMVLSGKVNKGLVRRLNQYGAKAVGLSGKDANMVLCRRIEKLGFVGEPVKIDITLIEKLVNSDYLPVISSIGFDKAGNTLNVNADSVAMGIAKALKASKLILLTDVPGVMDSGKNVIPMIRISGANKLISRGVITGGMIPKIKACAGSIRAGVKEVWIAHGSADLSCLRGTVLKK